MAKKTPSLLDAKTVEQLAAEQRRMQQDAEEEYVRSTWENFARNVALQVSSGFVEKRIGAVECGQWVADYCKAFRERLTTDIPTPGKVNAADPPGVQGQPDVS